MPEFLAGRRQSPSSRVASDARLRVAMAVDLPAGTITLKLSMSLPGLTFIPPTHLAYRTSRRHRPRGRRIAYPTDSCYGSAASAATWTGMTGSETASIRQLA